MKTRELTCIICPRGCTLNVSLGDDNCILGIIGNSCPRGKEYAESECTNPQRTVTSTIRCCDGTVVPVKTDKTIPKDKMFECMELINSATARLPIAIGDVIIGDVFGANVVATANRRGDQCELQ